jgi:hypothetical protein
MADVHSKETRSYNMSRIRSKDTKPEMLVRKFLHRNGFSEFTYGRLTSIIISGIFRNGFIFDDRPADYLPDLCCQN